MNYVLCTQARLQRTEQLVPLILTDEAIDFWGGVYLENPALHQLGISFEMFLAQPQTLLPAAQYTAVIPLTDFIDRLPLLPKQHAVRQRVDAIDAGQQALDLEPPYSSRGLA